VLIQDPPNQNGNGQDSKSFNALLSLPFFPGSFNVAPPFVQVFSQRFSGVGLVGDSVQESNNILHFTFDQINDARTGSGICQIPVMPVN